MRFVLTLILAIVICAVSVADDRDITINIYNDGFSQVTEGRRVNITKGEDVISLDDIAVKLDPASIDVRSNKFDIRTIDYQYDLICGERIYQKYLGENIEYKKDDSLYTGKLLSYDDDYLYIASNIYKGGVFIYERKDFEYIKLPDIPAELITQPQIQVTIDSKATGSGEITLSYLTGGLSWHTEYHLIYDGGKSADLSARVNFVNECGVAFPNADIILVAGQVEREEATSGSAEQAVSGTAVKAREAKLEPLVDYHRYRLPFRVTIGERENKQAYMFEQPEIEVEHYYKYEWSETKSDVKAMISFKNDKTSGLGLPLPAGRMNIFDKKTGSFLGSGMFEGTPSGEKAEIYLGTAFDITAERKRIEHKKIGRNRNSDTFEIKIRNHKSESVMVIVAEELYGYWDIVSESDDFIKKDFQNIEFNLIVKPGQEKTLTYSVEYSY